MALSNDHIIDLKKLLKELEEIVDSRKSIDPNEHPFSSGYAVGIKYCIEKIREILKKE
jgi:hypothetical protein